MDAARLAEILSDPTVLNLDCLLGDPDHAAIPGLKKIIMRHEGELIPHIDQRTYPWSGKPSYIPLNFAGNAAFGVIQQGARDFLAALAALGACVMAAEDALTDTQIDDYLEAVSPVSPSCICAVDGTIEWEPIEGTPQPDQLGHVSSDRGPSASSLHAAAREDRRTYEHAWDQASLERDTMVPSAAERAPETTEAIRKAKEILAEREQASDERLLEDIAEAKDGSGRDLISANELGKLGLETLKKLCHQRTIDAAPQVALHAALALTDLQKNIPSER